MFYFRERRTESEGVGGAGIDMPTDEVASVTDGDGEDEGVEEIFADANENPTEVVEAVEGAAEILEAAKEGSGKLVGRRRRRGRGGGFGRRGEREERQDG